MKNIASYIAGIFMVVFAAIPFIDFKIVAPGDWFIWLFAVAGFMGFYVFMFDIHPFVKCVPMFALFNSFLSSAPLISFIAYIQILACVYFYILCSKIKDFRPTFQILQALLLFNAFIYLMQLIGRDPLYNFDNNIYFGTVGQHMQSASFSVILAAALVGHNPGNLAFPFGVSALCNSAGGFISAGAGLVTFVFKKFNMKVFVQISTLILLTFSIWIILSGKLNSNLSMYSGRAGAWISSLKLYAKDFNKIFFGWGIGTYKAIFPALGGMESIPWKTAHNCWIQILFETGLTGLLAFGGYFFFLVSKLCRMAHRKVTKDKATACLVGLMMIAVNMMFHFPTRMIQTVLIIVFFLAYCQREVDNAYR